MTSQLNRNAPIFFPDKEGRLSRYMDELEEKSKRAAELEEDMWSMPDPEVEILQLQARCRRLRELIVSRCDVMLKKTRIRQQCVADITEILESIRV